MKIIKKYWKVYLEEIWYMNLIYWFVVFMDWHFEGNLDLFRPILITGYLIISGVSVWVGQKIAKRD